MAKTEHGKGSREQFGSERKKKKKFQKNEPKKKKLQKTQEDEPAHSSQLDNGGEDSELSNTKRESIHNTHDDDRKSRKKKKKKTKKNDGVGMDRVHTDDGNNSEYVSDQEDMLFNFNIPSEAADILDYDTATLWTLEQRKDTVLTGVEKSNVTLPLQEKQETIVVDENFTRRKKKKRNRDNGGIGMDRAHNDDRNNPVQKDMLFNFNLPSEAADIVDYDTTILWTLDKKKDTVLTGFEQSNVTSPLQEKQETIVVDENFARRKKKKRKREEEEGHAIYLEQTYINGSTQQDKKLLDEVSNKKHQLNEVENIEKPEAFNISQNNKCPSGLSIRPTLSMAVAGSIVDNAQSLQLATMLAGQIARAAAIFRVDEIVVFDDYDGAEVSSYTQDVNSEDEGGLFMVKILKYLEVPQYLRKALIPMHRSLYSAGKLPPLDAPHHLRKHEWRPFREGVVLDKRPSSSSGSCVDVGLDKEVLVKQSLKPGTRVTVAMGQHKSEGDVLQVVDREAARQAGFYWGYTVRYANCLSAVFYECPFEGKYDFCIGTSEHGEKLKSADLVIPKCKHLLVAFGGLSGLEESFELDKKFKKLSIRSVFDLYLNTCPDQGSRTIRTEEAILISLQYLQAAVQEALRTP